MRARLPVPWRRTLLAGAGLGVLLVLLAGPAAHADVWANVGPASPLGIGGLDGRWPLSNYRLDEHFTAISAGVFSGIDVSGLLPMIAYFFADLLWQFTAWLANTLIDLFGFAFSLDLLNGSEATGGAGALGPVARAIHSIYATVFGGPWMVAAISASGLWAMWRALIQRRYAETAGRLALSLAYVAVALLFVWQPAQTIGRASELTNSMSGAFLSIAKDGEPGSQEEAKQAGADQLFGLLVAQPWSVLEFGGLEHCVQAGGGEEPESVAVQPLPAEAARRLESGEEVSAGGKTCINDLKKYGGHFLRFSSESDERNEEFEALQKGDASKLPEADPSKAKGDYRLGPADEPAAAAMEKGGQYDRLLVALLVFVCELGAFCLLGALSVGVILAQVLLLLFLAFSPVALVAAVIPGRGHDFFKGWLSKLASLLLRKAAYSLLLAILLAVCAAISAATSELGWFFSFGLQCAFLWAVFLQRRSLTEGLIGTVTGPGVPGRDRTLNAVALYMGARTGTRLTARPFRAARSTFRGHRPGAAARPTGSADDRPGAADEPRRPETSGAAPVEPVVAASATRADGTPRREAPNSPASGPSGGTGGAAADGTGSPRSGTSPEATRRDSEAGRRDRESPVRPDGEADGRRPRRRQADRAGTDEPPRKKEETDGGGARRPGARKPDDRVPGSSTAPPPTTAPRHERPDLADDLRSDVERLGEERAGGKPGPTEQKAAARRADRRSQLPRRDAERPDRTDGRR